MSDLAKQYPAASAPGLYAGSTASYTAGAGTVKPAALGETSVKNSDLSRNYGDDRTK